MNLEDGGVKLTFNNIESSSNELPKDGQEIHVAFTLTKAGDTKEVILTKESFSFVLGANKVIKGFEVAVRNMKVGQKAKVWMRSDLAYGKLGQPPEIANDEDLVFDLNLLGCKTVSLDSLGILNDASKIEKANEVKAAAN